MDELVQTLELACRWDDEGVQDCAEHLNKHGIEADKTMTYDFIHELAIGLALKLAKEIRNDKDRGN